MGWLVSTYHWYNSGHNCIQWRPFPRCLDPILLLLKPLSLWEDLGANAPNNHGLIIIFALNTDTAIWRASPFSDMIYIYIYICAFINRHNLHIISDFDYSYNILVGGFKHVFLLSRWLKPPISYSYILRACPIPYPQSSPVTCPHRSDQLWPELYQL